MKVTSQEGKDYRANRIQEIKEALAGYKPELIDQANATKTLIDLQERLNKARVDAEGKIHAQQMAKEEQGLAKIRAQDAKEALAEEQKAAEEIKRIQNERYQAAVDASKRETQATLDKIDEIRSRHKEQEEMQTAATLAGLEERAAALKNYGQEKERIEREQ